MCALPVICDVPWDLREELSSSLQQVVNISKCQSLSGDNMELLVRCVIFHSVLLQRQTYKCSSQGVTYNW